MISVEQIIQELRRVQGRIPSCAAQCRQCRDRAENAANSLGVFGSEAEWASSWLTDASNCLFQAQTALEQLNSRINDAVLALSK